LRSFGQEGFGEGPHVGDDQGGGGGPYCRETGPVPGPRRRCPDRRATGGRGRGRCPQESRTRRPAGGWRSWSRPTGAPRREWVAAVCGACPRPRCTAPAPDRPAVPGGSQARQQGSGDQRVDRKRGIAGKLGQGRAAVGVGFDADDPEGQVGAGSVVHRGQWRQDRRGRGGVQSHPLVHEVAELLRGEAGGQQIVQRRSRTG
jgi:hypothetical protein